MRCIAAALALACFFLGSSTTAHAQEPREHRGFWISFGGGAGYNFHDVVETDNDVGKAAYVRMGGTPSQQILVGGEANYWGHGDFDRGNLTLSLMYYPSSKGGLFGRLGVGWSFLDVDKERSGLGVTAGIGFDVRLAKNFYITPNLDWVFSYLYDTEVAPEYADIVDIRSANSILMLTVGVTWH